MKKEKHDFIQYYERKCLPKGDSATVTSVRGTVTRVASDYPELINESGTALPAYYNQDEFIKFLAEKGEVLDCCQFSAPQRLFTELTYKGSGKFIRSNFSGATLYNINMSNADISECEMSTTRFYKTSGVFGASANILHTKLPLHCKWPISLDSKVNTPTLWTDFDIAIGCYAKSIKRWDKWFADDTKVYQTPRDTFEFRQIRAAYEGYKAFLINLFPLPPKKSKVKKGV